MMNDLNTKQARIDVCDLLNSTESLVSFVQSITLITSGGELCLERSQVTGLYYSLEVIRDNILKAVRRLENTTETAGTDNSGVQKND